MDRISVVIPTYNRADYIIRSVKSALEQTVKPYEIIVVDDGSTDNTKEKIDELNNECIKYVYQENGGAASARNKGAEVATGDWIAFNDSDDVWRPEKLKEQIEHAHSDDKFDLIYCAYSLTSPSEKIERVPYSENISELEGNIFLSLVVMNTIGTPTVMVKRNDFLSVGGFDTGLRCIEDWDFAVRFSKEHKIGFVNKVLVDAYTVDSGVSTNISEMFSVRCKMIAENKDVLLSNNIFDRAVSIMFEAAERMGCLEQVQKMLMLYLKGC